MNASLVDRFLKLIPGANRQAFEENQLTADPKLTFLHVFDYFWEQFGIATVSHPWQPDEGMEVLIARFDQTQVYAFFARNLMDDKTLINYFLTVIKKTGKYTRAYEDWMAKQDADKTYAHLKEYWRLEHLKMKRTNPTAK